MYKKIAVEKGLSNVVQAVQAAGYQTMPLQEELYNIQAVVVKGDTNEFIATDKNIKVPVINASGRSANEVVDLLNDKLH